MAAKAAESAEILNKLFDVEKYPALKLFFVVAGYTLDLCWGQNLWPGKKIMRYFLI